MVSVVKRPTGHKLIDQAITATITESYEGDALVNFTAHALSDEDVIYLTSDIDEYNGFWYVTIVTPNSFKISEYESAEFVEYYQDADIQYYQTQEHDWSSIFLPIVYKLTNDQWPINDADSLSVILSNVDDNGFTEITLPGPLRSSVNALEFVKISNASTPEANGVWQIVDVVLSNVYVINLPYESSGNLIGATVQYYYNNYQVKVKIFAGLPASHPWQAKKPFTEVAELSLTPDENNEVMFSIADYISSDVKVRNNLTLYSLPLNLDAFTSFYISTGESYDQSDNYSLYTSESSFTADTFEGYAIAGKLPFKNLYAGDYADYVYTSGSPAHWLTVQERPLMVMGYFFDLSFIKNIIGNFNVIITKYIADYATTTESIPYQDMGLGVYRIPITPDANYDSFCVVVTTDSRMEEVEVPPPAFNLEDFENDPASLSDLWTLGSTPFILNSDDSRVLYISYPTTMGTPYRFNYKFQIEDVTPGSKSIALATLDAAIGGISGQLIPITSNGIYEGFVIITPSANGLYFGLNNALSSVPFSIYVLELSVGESTTEEVEVPGATITEEICIDILDACDVSDGFTPSGIRLLEDGGYRLLE